MDYLTTVLIGISLAMDCLAICVCISGIQKLLKHEYVKVPMSFGLFQAGMILLGFYIGRIFESIIRGYYYWVAFILLSIIGTKMIMDHSKAEEECKLIRSHKDLFVLSIATSLDALIVGMTLNAVDMTIFDSALIIGAVTFLISYIGLKMGKRIRDLNIKYAGLFGGLVLIGIGVKTLLEHLH